MDQISAWEYWFKDDDRVRQVMVAEPDEAKARNLLQSKCPMAIFLARKAIPLSVAQLLKLKPGQMTEWRQTDGKDADPKFATTKMS